MLSLWTCDAQIDNHYAVMTIPLNILWRSRIPLRQSIALGAVFSLVLVTVTFSIVRAALSTVGVTKQMDSPWVLVWSCAEASIAIIVACIGSFRMLFVQNRREDREQRRGPGARAELRMRRVDKTTSVEQGASVEEMASVPESTEWSEMGTVQSTLASTMQSGLASESTMMRSGSSWGPASSLRRS